MCTLLRLSFKDFAIEVPPPQAYMEELDEEEYYIATTPGLLPEDISCLRFNKKMKKILSKTLYDFLMEHEILPQDSRSSSYQYLKEAHRGRSIRIRREDPKIVYVIVDGSMRLQVIKPKDSNNDLIRKPANYEISCRREGHINPVTVKVSPYPFNSSLQHCLLVPTNLSYSDADIASGSVRSRKCVHRQRIMF